MLVSAPTKDIALRDVDEHMAELGRLTDTAGALVVGTLQQRLDKPHPKLYIGEGKANELKDLIKELDATLVIFDEDLTPAQGKNLEAHIETRIMDRAELILDIFATRARSHEAQMQVELAQLQYMMPRLKRMWTHLSRIRAGVGARGPGETQIETDRRLIRHRIRDLREKLDTVASRRATQRKGRSDELRAALVGYTNAGKSSLLKGLSGADVLIEDRLFATLDPSTRAVAFETGSKLLLTDTVGFIRKLPHHLVASFRATLEEATNADVLLHVIDASHPSWEEHKEVVEAVLADLGASDIPQVIVFNKIDRLTHAEEQGLRERAVALFDTPTVFTTSLEERGMDELRALLFEQVRGRRPEVRISIPWGDGEALASVYREGEVLSRDESGAAVDLVARVPPATLGRLRARSGILVAPV
ncbi:MAG: GTPase HflX [Longimicrobiales bacterium]